MTITIALGTALIKIAVSTAAVKAVATTVTVATCYGGARLVKELVDD